MKKTKVRLVLGSIVLMAAVATGCGSDTIENNPGTQPPAAVTAQGPGGYSP